MLSIKGFYESGRFLATENFSSNKRHKIIITILDEESEIEKDDIRNFAYSSNSFDFWKSDDENLYQEYIK
ncbi:MAG: hypothetical protein EAZ53_01110 [Bacteroidetes bacterium]|nr:MAG: hypothetical protein EAZ53_01110 [Bacteroidota bacterium]